MPNAKPFRLSNHSDMKRMDGLYAIHPPTPNPIPWDKIRCVTLEANELNPSDKHIIMTPVVATQRATLGTRIMPAITAGVAKYATP